MGVHGHHSGLALVFDVWSNCLFFHSVLSHKTGIEATMSCEVTAFWKIRGTWKIEVLCAKHIPFWLKGTALPPVIGTNPGLMKNRLIFLIWSYIQELKETVRFLLRRNTYLLSKCEQPPWSSWDITKLVKLLSSLVSSHLEGQGCHQQGERHWARGKLQ